MAIALIYLTITEGLAVYSEEVAQSVTSTIGKFATLNRHQLAGHLVNVDFWVGETRHALDVLDGYEKRQRALEKAQREYIGRHDTRRFSREEKMIAGEFPDDEAERLRSATPDHYRLDKTRLTDLRRSVVDSLYAFLKRCYNERLMEGERASELLSRCGIGVEPGDFSA